jgi:predicted TIM-barrel fold metal-dependent hydrolase
MLSCPPSLLGDRSLHPLYEAACELGLPVALRVGGEFTGANKGLTGAGFPATTFEYELGAMYSAQPHVLSLALNGVFDRFPDITVIFSGYGAAWLPSLVWRADREFRLGRLEPPRTLVRPPSEIIVEHLRFTTCPLELPEAGVELAMLLALVDAKTLLLFGSGALGDSPADLVDLPEAWRAAVLAQNAVDCFGLQVHA